MVIHIKIAGDEHSDALISINHPIAVSILSPVHRIPPLEWQSHIIGNKRYVITTKCSQVSHRVVIDLHLPEAQFFADNLFFLLIFQFEFLNGSQHVLHGSASQEEIGNFDEYNATLVNVM